MTTNPTHVLLIPCEMLTMEEAAEIKAHLTERLPSWVEPVLLGGGRGSATLIPYEPPTKPLVKLTYPSTMPPAEWAEQWVSDAIRDATGPTT